MASGFKTRLKNLSFKKKLILIGAALLALSTLMPWYSDLDRFNAGDTFLGLTGPIYLAGWITLAAAASSFAVIFLQLKGRKVRKLPLAEGNFHLLNSSVAIAMLILTNSVYFHPKFGINIADKSMGIGMNIAFLAVAIFAAGSFLARKEKVEFVETVSIEAPLFEDQEATISTVRTIDEVMPVDHQREPQNLGEISRANTIEEAIAAHQSRISNNTNDIK